MAPVIRAAIPKSGIVLLLENTTRDGPINSLGCEVLSLYYFTAISRTAYLVEQLANIPLGKNLDIR